MIRIGYIHSPTHRYISKDDRNNFAYALKIGLRYFGWLHDHCPQDFRQSVSLACTLYNGLGVTLSRTVQRELYQLAMDLGFRQWRRQDGKRGWQYKPLVAIAQSFSDLPDLYDEFITGRFDLNRYKYWETRQCLGCGVCFPIEKHQVKQGRGKHCSMECAIENRKERKAA